MEEENKNIEENVQPVEPVVEQAPVEPITVEEPKPELNNNEKQKKPIPTIIFVLLILLFFVIGIFLGRIIFGKEKIDKNESAETTNNENTESNNTEPTNTENTNNEVVTMDINDSVVQQLFNTFKYEDENYYLIGEKLNTINNIRLELAYRTLDSSEKKERSCSDLEPYISDKGLYCGDMSAEMSKYYPNYPENDEPFKKATMNNTTTYVEENSLISKYNELFSSNYPYKGENFASMIYYNDKSLYAYYGCECGGTYSDTTHTINSAYKIDDKLYLETVYDDNENKYNVKYEFILENGNYKFLKVTETK